MILYPQSLILSALLPLTHARIGYQSWLEDLTAASVTVSGETAAGPRDAPLRPETSGFWEPPFLPATWLIDLGAVRPVNYIGIGDHMLGSNGCSALWEISSDGLSFDVFSTGDLLPADDGPILWLDDEDTEGRYLRLTVDGDSDALPPRIGPIRAGEVLAMERPVYGGVTPPNLARETVLYSGVSEGGQYLGQEFRRHGIRTPISFNNLTAAWVRAQFDPFIKAARGAPYFFAWRPLSFPLEVAYAWAGADIRPSNMGKRGLMQVGWELRGIGHE